MSNLPPKITHFDTENFKATTRRIFHVSDQATLDLDLACQVGIKAAPEGSKEIVVALDVDPNDKSKFEITQNGNLVSVVQELENSMNVTGNGVNVSFRGAQNISISNGVISINGRVVTSGGSSPTTRMARVLVTVPEQTNLIADLSGTAELISIIPHDEAELELSGQSRASLLSNSLEADVSGQSKIEAVIDNGKLKVDVSGQSNVHAKGSFSKVSADASGQSSVQTEGEVKGNYSADASGMSNVTHFGIVLGRVSRDSSGMSRISIG